METANQLLAEIQKVKVLRSAAGRQGSRPGRVPVPQAEQPRREPQIIGQDTRPSIEGLRTNVENLQLSPAEQISVAEQRQQPQMPAPEFYSPPPVAGPPSYSYSPGEAPQSYGRIPPGARVPDQPMPHGDISSGRYQVPLHDGHPPSSYPQVDNSKIPVMDPRL